MADISLARLWHPRFWLTWLGLACMRAISLLPLPLIAFFGGVLGLLLYALHAERRRIVHVNIERCFPEMSGRQQARLARRHFRAFGQTLLDTGIAWWASPARIKRLTRFRGREHYEQALRENKSIILMTPHFLGLEIGGVRLSMERPMATIFRHPTNEAVRWVMQRARSRFHMQLVEHNKPLTAAIRQVKRGSPLYYLSDQDAGRRNAVFAPFFGIPAATFIVLPRLAEMTGAAVLPCYTRQLSWGRGYEIIFRPPLSDFPSADPVADTTRMNQEIEECVRAAPEQYFWLHKRFKTRPKGEKDFY